MRTETKANKIGTGGRTVYDRFIRDGANAGHRPELVGGGT